MNLISEKISLPERYSVSSPAKVQQAELVELSQTVTSVTTPANLAVASEIGSRLQRHIKEVKEARMSLARPLNEACDCLIQLENEYCAVLLAEKDRLGRLVTSFKKSEAERVAAEERKRAEEIARLEKIRIEAEMKARKAAEKGNEAKSLAAEQKAYHATEAANAAIMAPVPTVSTARGSATRRTLKYKVLSIAQVYSVRPELCKIEEKASAINATCFAKEDATVVNPDTESVPGLALWWTDNTYFRL